MNVWLLVQYIRYVSTYMGWKFYLPRTYVHDKFHIHMRDYLFTKNIVYTRGVCVCTYVPVYFICFDGFSPSVLIFIISNFSILINKHLCSLQDSRSTVSSKNLNSQLQYLGNLVQQNGIVKPVSTLLALNQTGKITRLQMCIIFIRLTVSVTILSYRLIFSIEGINDSDLFLFARSSL